jgi:acyl carrier protein
LVCDSGPSKAQDSTANLQGTEDPVVTVQEIEDKVISIVSEQMGINKAEITREVSFINDLNADSLDIVELVMELEDSFEMQIPDEEAEKIKTVGQAIDYIAAHQNQQQQQQ